MIQIFRRFFDFCGETNKRKFTKSIFLGVLKALFEALKIPARRDLAGCSEWESDRSAHSAIPWHYAVQYRRQCFCKLPLHHAPMRSRLWYLRRQAH